MALVDSLLTAIVRSDGDALVMHVGERPYVVAPAGPIELSAQGLNLQAMAGMVGQLLPPEMQRMLLEFGAVEHELPNSPAMPADRFTAVVARGGEDVWIEIRRHRHSRTSVPPQVVVPDVATENLSTPEPHPGVETSALLDSRVAAVAASVGLAEHMPETGSVGTVSSAPEQGEAVASAPPADRTPMEMSPAKAEQAAPDTPAETVIPAHADDAERERSVVPHMQEEAEPRPVAIVPEPEAQTEQTPPAVDTQATPHTDEAPEDLSVAGAETPIAIDAVASVEQVATQQDAPFEIVAAAGDAAATAGVTSPYEGPAAAAATGTEAAQPAYDKTAPRAAPATVIPMMRTVRIEVPPPASRPTSGPSEVERLLRVAVARGATALYLTTHTAPFVRVDDDVHVLEGEPPLSSAEVETAARELMPDATRDTWVSGNPFEWESEIAEVGHVRCTTFRDQRGPGAIFHLTSSRPIAAEHLELSDDITALATEAEGFVLVASPPGHGKTTVVGALIDLINRKRPGYVISIERQVRLVHEPQTALISQREVSGAPDQMLTAVRGALRENPDVLVIEDITAPEVFQLALAAAEPGRLVFATVEAPSAIAALVRLVESVPPDNRAAIQSLLAERLLGAVSQVRLRRNGGGRVAAREVVLTTAAVSRAIGQDLEALTEAVATGRKLGLVSLTESLVALVRNGMVDVREAYRRADDRAAFLQALKRENVDTSVLARFE